MAKGSQLKSLRRIAIAMHITNAVRLKFLKLHLAKELTRMSCEREQF